MNTISVDKLESAISSVLGDYREVVVKGVKETSKKSITALVKQTKATAPVGKREKHYRDHIASRTIYENDQGAEYQWYVKAPDYALSHLLEHGHALRNGGRSKATHFIANALEPIANQYIEQIEEILKDG